jgi:diguanylate cyclase (GGDEF)-like protein
MLEVLFPNPSSTSFELHYKLRYLGLLFFAPALHRLCLAALKRRNESKLERYQRVVLWLFGGFILFFSAADFTLFVPVLAVLFTYNMFRSILEVYRAWQYREPGSLWLLVGVVALAFAMLLQPLSYTLHTETRLAIQVAVVIFVFLQSQFIGLRFNTALNESRFLSEHLQEEIMRKTRDLRQQQKELMSLRGELQSASLIDKTTGIYSRAYFENQLNIEWSRCMREKRSLAMILFDMDGSKRINRDYGRNAGDKWLYHFAHSLSDSVRRQTDIAVRYGGDEFALLLPDCDLDEATKIAQAFLERMHGETIEVAGQPIGFSVTAGVQATQPHEDSTATEELINRVVVALHYAKEHKRGEIHAYRAKHNSSDDEE